jgi:hypothetical protein
VGLREGGMRREGRVARSGSGGDGTSEQGVQGETPAVVASSTLVRRCLPALSGLFL